MPSFNGLRRPVANTVGRKRKSSGILRRVSYLRRIGVPLPGLVTQKLLSLVSSSVNVGNVGDIGGVVFRNVGKTGDIGGVVFRNVGNFGDFGGVVMFGNLGNAT